MTVPDKMMNPATNMETRTDEELEKALARVRVACAPRRKNRIPARAVAVRPLPRLTFR